MAKETLYTELEDAGGGMPQLELTTFPNQIFWLLVTLVLIYIVMSRIAIPRIGDILDRRRASIDDNLARADELRKLAEDAESAYQQALKDAQREAQRIIGDAKAEIQSDLDKAIEVADKEIAEKSAQSEKHIAEIRAQALTNVQKVAHETAQALIENLSPAKVSSKKLDEIIASQLKG